MTPKLPDKERSLVPRKRWRPLDRPAPGMEFVNNAELGLQDPVGAWGAH